MTQSLGFLDEQVEPVVTPSTIGGWPGTGKVRAIAPVPENTNWYGAPPLTPGVEYEYIDTIRNWLTSGNIGEPAGGLRIQADNGAYYWYSERLLEQVTDSNIPVGFIDDSIVRNLTFQPNQRLVYVGNGSLEPGRAYTISRTDVEHVMITGIWYEEADFLSVQEYTRRSRGINRFRNNDLVKFLPLESPVWNRATHLVTGMEYKVERVENELIEVRAGERNARFWYDQKHFVLVATGHVEQVEEVTNQVSETSHECMLGLGAWAITDGYFIIERFSTLSEASAYIESNDYKVAYIWE